MAEKLSAAQAKAIDWISGHNALELGALGIEIGRMLAELTAELADAKQEAAHWKQSFEVVRDEIKVLASVAIAKKGERLVITKKDFAACLGLELYVGKPEEGVRIYELRRPVRPLTAIEQHAKNAINGRLLELPPGVKPS